KIKLLDPGRRSVHGFAGSGKPGQVDGKTPSFYEPGGLAVAKDKLYVADTNNHAIRVVDLKTKETTTLQIKGLQPPASTKHRAMKQRPTRNRSNFRRRNFGLVQQQLSSISSCLPAITLIQLRRNVTQCKLSEVAKP